MQADYVELAESRMELGDGAYSLKRKESREVERIKLFRESL